MILAIAIRFYGIAQESLWTDEGYSLWFSQQTQADIWGDIARAEFNPVLYYSLLAGWTGLFGNSETALRSLSVLINCATLFAVYATARWALPGREGRAVALLASALFALSFLQIEYSQEARTYALEGLGMALVLAASARILRGRFDPAPAPLWSYGLLGVGAALMVWSHYTALVALTVMGAVHGALLVSAQEKWRTHLVRHLVSALVFAFLAGPALWLMFAYSLPGSRDFWISVPSLADTLDAATTIFGAALGLESWSREIALRALIFAPWPLLGAWAAWRTGRGDLRAFAALLAMASVGAFTAMLVVSWAGKPIFLQRTLVPMQLGWILLCALAPLAVKAPQAKRVLAAGVACAFGLGALAFHVARPPILEKEPWRDQARHIAETAPADTRVFTAPAGEILLDYYLTRMGRTDIQVVSLSGPMATPPPRAPFERTAAYFTPAITPAAAETVDEAIAAGGPVWVVMRRPDARSWGPVREVLAAHGAGPETRRVMMPGPLAVYAVTPSRRLVGFSGEEEN